MADASSPSLSPANRLLLHQLQTLAWLDARSTADPHEETTAARAAEPPTEWELTRGVTLYPWQEACISRWFEQDGCGTVKVVTGGGKTLLALAIAERLQHVEPGLRVAIVVPTIVLMHQWYDELIERGNLPARLVGRLGGGHSDDFGEDRRILIAVLVSASQKLAGLVSAAGCAERLFLVADECHRAGADQMSRVFETRRRWSLGLSATPERDEDDDDDESAAYADSPLGKELGPIIYEFSLADALELGVVPRFTIRHYGLPLSPEERVRYEKLSREIANDQSELRALAPQSAGRGGRFFGWTRTIARQGGDFAGLAARFQGNVERRKQLLYAMNARVEAVVALIRDELEVNPDARVLLFHEKIDEVMRIFLRLRGEGFAVVAEHSELPSALREEGLQLFRRGVAQVMVSAKSLIEGFNVPAVDVGIIVASSGSVRQRIQSLGRVLRRHRGRGGEEKTSVMHVLYAAGTTDEMIYAKVDWAHTTGVESNLYYAWDAVSEPIEQAGPPRSPLPRESEVDVAALEEGEEYPGAYEGDDYTCDSQGNIRRADATFVADPGGLVAKIRKAKGSAGRFKVTREKHVVLVRIPDGDDWFTRYVTRLESSLREVGGTDSEVVLSDDELERWARDAAPGTPYPLRDEPAESYEIQHGQKRGGVLIRHDGSRQVFARTSDRANNRERGLDAERVLATLDRLRRAGDMVKKLSVTPLRHVVFRVRGELKFLCRLEAGLEFPD